MEAIYIKLQRSFLFLLIKLTLMLYISRLYYLIPLNDGKPWSPAKAGLYNL